MEHWIDAEILPKKTGNYLVCIPHPSGRKEVTLRFYSVWWGWRERRGKILYRTKLITHWMMLPSPPNE